MITATFFKKDGKIYKFHINGHSGYAESGSDIVCAAVSSMAFLTINNITESFSVAADISVDDDGADLKCSVSPELEIPCVLMAGLHRELCILAEDYPKFVKVILN